MIWKEPLLKQNSKFREVDFIYSQGTVSGNKFVSIIDDIGGTNFYERSQIAGTHTFFDTKILYRKLGDIFRETSPKVIIDMGCGDGRVTEWFLKNTGANIIAVDCSMRSLRRLQKNYLDGRNAFINRTMLIHSNIIDVPLTDACCDFIWAFEVLYYLEGEYESGIQECYRLLQPGGVLVNGERNKQIGMLYELLNRGPEGLIKCYHSSMIIDIENNNQIMSRLFESDEMQNILQAHGFARVGTTGISLFPLIISYLKWKGLFIEEIDKYADELSHIFGEISSEDSVNRVNIYISKKAAEDT